MNIFHRNSIRLIKKYEKNWLKYLSEPLPLINNRDKYIKYFINKEEDSEICLIKWFPRTETDIHLHPIRGCSYKLLYYVLEQNLKANTSIIVESNFISEFSNKVFNEFTMKYSFDIIQIMCETE